MDELALIAGLRMALSEMKMEAAWTAVLQLESALEDDPDCSDHEARLLSQLRSDVSDVIAAPREGRGTHIASAADTLTDLEKSIGQRNRTAIG